MASKKLSLEQKWQEQAELLTREAERLPYGKEREDLLRKARQLDTASHINQWLSSPGLQPPTTQAGSNKNALPKIICPLAGSLKKALIAECIIVRTTAV